jgi:general stress protein 26
MLFTTEEEQQHIIEFMKSHSIAVLATADPKAVPHATTIYVSFDEHTKNFYFITRKGTAKYDNLTRNPQAAIALYESSTQTTIQAKGPVTEENDPKRVETVFQDIVKASRLESSDNVPPVTQLYAGSYVAFRLTPESVHMATYSRHDPGNPEKIIKDR